MDPLQVALPVLGIAAAAAVTFYAVSFKEMSDKSFEDLDSKLAGKTQLKSGQTSKQRRQLRKALKEKKADP